MRNWIRLCESKGPTSIQDVANHFLDTRDDLLDDIGHDISDEDAMEIIRREYVSGTCGAYAVALHDETGYPIVGINGGLHIAVQAPDGDIIDFMGKNPLPKVLKRYGFGKGTSVEEWSRDEAVEHVRMGGFEDSDVDPWDEINIAKWVLSHLTKI